MDIDNYLQEELGEFYCHSEFNKWPEQIRIESDGGDDEGNLAGILRRCQRNLRSYYDSLSSEEWNMCSGGYKDSKRGFMEFTSEKIRKENPHVIVEGGCGQGLELIYLAGEFPEITFYGYDLSRGNMRKVTARKRKHKTGNVRLSVSTHETYEFPETDMICINASLGEEGYIVNDDFSDIVREIYLNRARRFHDALSEEGSFIVSFPVQVIRNHWDSYIQGVGFKKLDEEVLFRQLPYDFTIFHYRKTITT